MGRGSGGGGEVVRGVKNFFLRGWGGKKNLPAIVYADFDSHLNHNRSNLNLEGQNIVYILENRYQ